MENIIIEGKLLQVLEMQEGVSTRGAWKKQDFVLETTEQYPKKVCISCWNEKADEIKNFQTNDMLKVAINIESREYNSRWYTDIKAWRIDAASGANPSSNQPTNAAPPPAADDVTGVSFSNEEDELPF